MKVYLSGVLKRTEVKEIPKISDLILDSGAFTFFSSGTCVDWIEYLKRYAAFINRHKVEHFFELDIDKLVGYEKVLEFRRRLEDGTGRQCIPVWHKSRGKEAFLEMCEDYSYVAIGGIASKEIMPRQHSAFPWFIREAHRRGARIHGLGYTNAAGMARYHWDSVDSTSWVSGCKYGHYYQFDGTSIRYRDLPEGKRLKNSTEAAAYSLNEWAKFQKYASKHL